MDPYTAHSIIRDGTVVALAAILFIGLPVARAHARRIEKTPREPRNLSSGEASDARLERVERAVEAMAIEVERMSEGQRFMTRLLSDPPGPKLPNSGGQKEA
ncbi:MAG: hypothetical protein ABI035_01300 [Gemmatimonadaceae bacterium]